MNRRGSTFYDGVVMRSHTELADVDIVELICLADLLDPRDVSGRELDPSVATARRRVMCTAPSSAAASAYVAWHNAYLSLSPAERGWLAQAVAADVDQG